MAFQQFVTTSNRARKLVLISIAIIAGLVFLIPQPAAPAARPALPRTITQTAHNNAPELAKAPVSVDTATADLSTVSRGQRLLWINTFFLFDYESGLHLHHSAVEGQLCEFAASRGVKVDLMLIKPVSSSSLLKQLKPDRVLRPCIDKVVTCKKGSIVDCYKKHSVLASRNYAAVWTRDDESLMGTHELLKLLKLPTMLHSDASLDTFPDTKWQTRHLLGPDRFTQLDECVLPESLSSIHYPGYIKYAHGVHGTGGWGGSCLRHMSTVRNEEELKQKLPFFCGSGMRSYHYLQTKEQRALFMAPYLFGIELAAEVVVFRGEAVAIEYQSGMYTCGDKLVHTFPAYWPSLDTAARKQCDQLVQKTVAMLQVRNMVLGIQLLFDWRRDEPTFGCSFIEANLRPHDWDILTDHSFGVRHYKRWFDYGAVSLSLAFDQDPRSLIVESPPAFQSQLISSCPLNQTGANGFMDQKSLYKAWTTNPACTFAVDHDPAEAFARVEHALPCLKGPIVLAPGDEMRKLCHNQIDEGFFWWSDNAALNEDIDTNN